MNLDIASPPFWDTFGNTLLIGGSIALGFLIVAIIATVLGNLAIFKADDLYPLTVANDSKLEEEAELHALFKKLETRHERLILVAIGFLSLTIVTAAFVIFASFLQYNSATQENLTQKVFSEVNTTYKVEITSEQASFLSADADGDYYLYNVVKAKTLDNSLVEVAIRRKDAKYVLVYYEEEVKISDLQEVDKK